MFFANKFENATLKMEGVIFMNNGLVYNNKLILFITDGGITLYGKLHVWYAIHTGIHILEPFISVVNPKLNFLGELCWRLNGDITKTNEDDIKKILHMSELVEYIHDSIIGELGHIPEVDDTNKAILRRLVNGWPMTKSARN
jgi:hypothetical protein